jgi:hypothetical protein
MASLDKLRMNVKGIKEGRWVTVNPDEPFDLRVRGFTNKYRDALAQYQKDAIKEINARLASPPYLKSAEDLPPTIAEACTARALAEHVFIDVRGLGDPSNPITADQLREMLLNTEEWAPLVVLVMAAAGMVTSDRSAEGVETGNA